jgi:hypothetical protein
MKAALSYANNSSSLESDTMKLAAAHGMDRRRAISTDILHFRARVPVIPAARGC